MIIRTRNEERALGPTLRSVLGQTVPPHEVIVIDSGSTDGTLRVAQEFPVRVMHISPAEWSYPRAINRAATSATGDVLVCLSAHCAPVSDDWLGDLLNPFADPDVAAVWGPGRRPGRPTPEPKGPLRLEPGTYNVDNRWWGPSNANCALRRDLWLQFPFDESLPATEDKAWAMEAMRRGYSIVHEPSAAVWHERHEPAAIYRRNRAVMAGFARMFPELRKPARSQLARVARFGGRTVLFHVRNRDLKVLLYDLRRLPSFVAGLVGDVVGTRTR